MFVVHTSSIIVTVKTAQDGRSSGWELTR